MYQLINCGDNFCLLAFHKKYFKSLFFIKTLPVDLITLGYFYVACFKHDIFPSLP